MKLTIYGEPKSTNTLYNLANNTMYMTQKGKKLKKRYEKQLMSKYNKDPLECMLKLDVKLYYRTAYERDVDNGLKILLDSLEGQVIKDDVQIQDIRIRKYLVDEEQGKVQLNFTKLVPEEDDEIKNWYVKK